MILVQFLSDFEYVASEERGKTNALHIVYLKGMIVDVSEECADWAISDGSAECLEPDETAADEPPEAEAV